MRTSTEYTIAPYGRHSMPGLHARPVPLQLAEVVLRTAVGPDVVVASDLLIAQLTL